MINKIEEAKNYIISKIDSVPGTSIILGTGLGSISELLSQQIILDFSEIPGFVTSTAPSHQGRLIFGNVDSNPVLIMQGRFHYYEGYSMEEITFPIRVFKSLGIKNLIITNAAGSLNENLVPGDIVKITDHINFIGTNPLIGNKSLSIGERFPSMHQPYDIDLQDTAQKISDRLQLDLKSGVYVAVSGPSLETRTECLMFQKLGADLVGMSTVPEVIVAVQSKIKILGISIVTNFSNIFHSESHSQEEIRDNAQKAKTKLKLLFKNIINEIL